MYQVDYTIQRNFIFLICLFNRATDLKLKIFRVLMNFLNLSEKLDNLQIIQVILPFSL
jgi:hypothetical protein